MVESATEQRLEVAVENAPFSDRLLTLLRNQRDKNFLEGIYGGDGIVDPNDTTPSKNERAEAFQSLLNRQYPDFDDLKPGLQRKALEATLREFERFEALEERIQEEKERLSPAARARLEAKSTISDLTLSARKRERELNVFLRDEGKAYRALKKQAKIGGLGNLFHATLGRHVFSPLNRYIGQPIMSISKTQKQQRGPFWKMVGLSALAVLGAAAVVGSGGLLIGAIAAGGGWGLAMPCIGVLASGWGTWEAGKNISEAYENWRDVRETALSEQDTRDKAFAEKNDAYRDGNSDYVRGLEASNSVIKIKGFDERDFQGREGSLDVTSGSFLMSKRMFQQYNGIVEVGFNRKTGELVFALTNTDGLSSDQITNIIEDIVARATGKKVTNATVLGQTCNSLDDMTKVLKDNAETTLLNNRLDQLKSGLPAKMDQILTGALLHGAPKNDKQGGGIAQYLAIARNVMGISSETHQTVLDGFNASATHALEAALRELTGKQDITLEGANPVSAAATQIMGNVTKGLSPEQQKLTLVKAALGGSVPEELKLFQKTIVTAASIEIAKLGLQKQLKAVADIRDKLGESPDSHDYARAGTKVLNTLGIKLTKSTNDADRQAYGEIAQGILRSTGHVSAEALQVVAAQTQAAVARG